MCLFFHSIVLTCKMFTSLVMCLIYLVCVLDAFSKYRTKFMAIDLADKKTLSDKCGSLCSFINNVVHVNMAQTNGLRWVFHKPCLAKFAEACPCHHCQHRNVEILAYEEQMWWGPEFIRSIKLYSELLSFVDTEMRQGFIILPYGTKGPLNSLRPSDAYMRR